MHNSNDQPSGLLGDEYDQAYRTCSGFAHTKPTNIVATGIGGFSLGGVKNYTVQTFRAPDAGDTIFLIEVSGEQARRFMIPPDVSNVIAAQRDAISKRNRQAAAKRGVETRRRKGTITPKGVVPLGFRNKASYKRKKGKK